MDNGLWSQTPAIARPVASCASPCPDVGAQVLFRTYDVCAHWPSGDRRSTRVAWRPQARRGAQAPEACTLVAMRWRSMRITAGFSFSSTAIARSVDDGQDALTCASWILECSSEACRRACWISNVACSALALAAARPWSCSGRRYARSVEQADISSVAPSSFVLTALRLLSSSLCDTHPGSVCRLWRRSWESVRSLASSVATRALRDSSSGAAAS
mmetsp:Transcript_11848/g.30396  ORF Transcript_11848/g.30396 Transcript_11848/m.30396 type:complete len:215 (+) Transcript_11848:200-844(+)